MKIAWEKINTDDPDAVKHLEAALASGRESKKFKRIANVIVIIGGSSFFLGLYLLVNEISAAAFWWGFLVMPLCFFFSLFPAERARLASEDLFDHISRAEGTPEALVLANRQMRFAERSITGAIDYLNDASQKLRSAKTSDDSRKAVADIFSAIASVERSKLEFEQAKDDLNFVKGLNLPTRVHSGAVTESKLENTNQIDEAKSGAVTESKLENTNQIDEAKNRTTTKQLLAFALAVIIAIAMFVVPLTFQDLTFLISNDSTFMNGKYRLGHQIPGSTLDPDERRMKDDIANRLTPQNERQFWASQNWKDNVVRRTREDFYLLTWDGDLLDAMKKADEIQKILSKLRLNGLGAPTYWLATPKIVYNMSGKFRVGVLFKQNTQQFANTLYQVAKAIPDLKKLSKFESVVEFDGSEARLLAQIRGLSSNFEYTKERHYDISSQ